MPPLLHRYLAEIHRPPCLPLRIVEYLQGEQRLGCTAAVDATAVTTLLFGAATPLAHTGPVRGPSHGDRAAQLPAVVATLVRGLKSAQQPEPRETAGGGAAQAARLAFS